MKKLILLIIYFYYTNALALSPARDLVYKARRNQQGLIQVLSEIKGDLSQITGKAQFNEYFEILPALRDYSEEHGLDQIYPGAIEDLGLQLAAHGSRWIRIDTDSIEYIISIQNWADLNSSQRFLYQIQDQILNMDDETPSAKVFENLIALSDLLAQKFPEDLYVSKGYSDIASSFAYEVLKTQSILSDDVSFWIAGLRNQTSLTEFLISANDSILSGRLSNEESLNLFKNLSLTGEHLAKGIFNYSITVDDLYGDVLSESITDLIIRGLEVEESFFAQTVNRLNASKLRHLSYRVINQFKIVSDEYYVYFYSLTLKIHSSLISKGLNEDAVYLLEKMSEGLDPQSASILGLEGTYLLKDNDGNDWFFTLIRANYNDLIATLASKDESVVYNFYNIQYSPIEGYYSASEFDLDYSSQLSNVVNFMFNPESNGMILNFPFSSSVANQTLIGSKIDSFEDVSKFKEDQLESLAGIYDGEMEILGIANTPVVLKMQAFGGEIIGNIKSNDGVLNVDLISKMDGLEGYIYLTGRCSFCGDTWLHLRVSLSEDRNLTGFRIIGGKEISNVGVNFVRR